MGFLCPLSHASILACFSLLMSCSFSLRKSLHPFVEGSPLGAVLLPGMTDGFFFTPRGLSLTLFLVRDGHGASTLPGSIWIPTSSILACMYVCSMHVCTYVCNLPVWPPTHFVVQTTSNLQQPSSLGLQNLGDCKNASIFLTFHFYLVGFVLCFLRLCLMM